MKKGAGLFRVEHIDGFHNASDAAYVNRALQQELEEREDENVTVNWNDLDLEELAKSDYEEEDDDGKTYGLGGPDPMEIDSPDERRRQLEGYKAELSQNWRDAERAEALLGSGTLAEFDAALEPLTSVNSSSRKIALISRIPEFTPNERRDKPHARHVRMNHLLGLDGDELIFPTSPAIAAY